jgi:4-aminobutyrate aminotransferase-like enzyme
MNHSLNPTLARLLTLCRMNRSWTRGEGVWLFDEDGRRFLGCYAQYGAVALGHNAPCVRDAVHAALAACEPAMGAALSRALGRAACQRAYPAGSRRPSLLRIRDLGRGCG